MGASVSNTTGQPEAGPPPVVNDRLHCSLPIDKPIYREILDDFLRDLPGRLDALSTALDQDDLAEVAEIAHGLNGTADSIGYGALTEPCRELEQFARQSQVEKLSPTIEKIRYIATLIVVPEGSVMTNSMKGKR